MSKYSEDDINRFNKICEECISILQAITRPVSKDFNYDAAEAKFNTLMSQIPDDVPCVKGFMDL